MSHPIVHAESSVRTWGGTPEDYLRVHEWFDSARAHAPDSRHRLILHNSFGIALAEQVFGPQIVNSAGKRVFVRDVGVQHVLEDLDFVPTLADCLQTLPVRPWMAGARRGLAAANVPGTEPELAHLAVRSGCRSGPPRQEPTEKTTRK